MKKVLLIILSTLFITVAFSQQLEKQRVKEIDGEITKAVDAGNYEKAGLLKKEKELTKKLIVALEAGDMGQAKSIKYEISQLDGEYDEKTVLERELDKAIAAEDFDKAAEIKKQIADIDSKKSSPIFTSTTAGTDYNPKRDKILKSGYFIDGTFGGAWFTAYAGDRVADVVNSGVHFGVRMGNRFNFGRSSVYRPGLNLNYARFHVTYVPDILGDGEGITYVSLVPIGVGFANTIKFSDVLGLEFNFNLNMHLMILSDADIDPQTYLGPMIDPTVKLRYKNLAFGFDITYSPLANVGELENEVGLRVTTFGVSVGAKF